MSLNISIPQLVKEGNYFEESFLTNKLEQLKSTVQNPKYGFFYTMDDQELLNQCKDAYQSRKDKIKTFVQVGIGGSSLGPEMLTSSLQKNDVKFIFINNIDPDMLHEQLEQITNIDETLFYFVSKSGGTAETMASLAIITNMLSEKGVSEENLKNYYIFGTDPVKSDLLDLGNHLGVTCLSVPSNVGGRFSVLTPVGYLPALFAGINLDNVISGTQEMRESLLDSNVLENKLLLTASYIMQLKDSAVVQTVFMPYSSKLRDLSFWFVQLWAESLGKKFSNDGSSQHQGLTPVPGYGATDQHSQMQLFMEGPFDKLLLLLEVDNFDHDFSLQNSLNTPSLNRLSDYSLAQLMKAEFNGTLTALAEAKRPYIHLTINKNDEFNIGALVIFFESLTALMGHYLNLDPFDQPGVEAGKKYAFEWLLRKR